MFYAYYTRKGDVMTKIEANRGGRPHSVAAPTIPSPFESATGFICVTVDDIIFVVCVCVFLWVACM